MKTQNNTTMITAIAKYIRNGIPDEDEVIVDEGVLTDDQDMLNLNIFRRLFDAELYDEVGITRFHAKIVG